MPTIAPLDLDEDCMSVGFLNDIPFFLTADGIAHSLNHGHQRTQLHDGLTCTHLDEGNQRFITGGEDGNIRSLNAGSTVQTHANIGSKWVTAVSAGPRESIAFAFGKNATVILSDGTEKQFSEERTIEDIAFAPKGLRIAFARYNQVSLNWITTQTPSSSLHWDGAHLKVSFSPDGKFIVTAMQENALHGWKIDVKAGTEPKNMRMSGYPTKVKSLSWSSKGKWLASSGAHSSVVWPFSSKDGPMGKAPLELGLRSDVMVTNVCFHPSEELLAIGYSDGMILASRLGDKKEILLRRPGKGAISAMSWSKDGLRLIFGSQTGDCGLIDLTV